MNDKPYFLFAGYDYYPGGGWKDFIGRYESAGEAVRAAHQRNDDCWHVRNDDWWHVIDVRTGENIESHNC
jgi:hypothetical protein